MRKMLLIVVAACLLTSCASVQKAMPAQREAARRAAQLQELQLNVMRFADEYKGRITEVVTRFQATSSTPEERLIAQNWKLQQSESVYLIASGPNPLTNALDLVVTATVSRMVMEDTWTLYGERTKPLLDAHRSLEKEAWELVAKALTAEQTVHLRDIIAQWREQNPNVRSVAAIHFTEFAKSSKSLRAGAEEKLGGLISLVAIDPFASFDPAVREIEQSRQLAERSIFYLQRAPSLINMQMERFTYQLATMPESKTLLASIDRVSLVGSAADRLATSLPEILATERKAILSQLSQELNNQRELIGGLSKELRSTLEAGTDTAKALNDTLETLDRLSARFAPRDAASAKPDENARPFDIREYTDTLRELSVAARDINALAQHLDSALPIVRSATQNLTGDLQLIADRAFKQLLILILVAIVGTLLAALAYRLVVTRVRSSS